MRTLLFILATAFAAPLCLAAERDMAPLEQRKPGQPILDSRQGWLTISNRDWVDYYLTMDMDNARILVDRQDNGGARIGSGNYLVVPLERAMWEIAGDSKADMVDVRIRSGQESELVLVPTGSSERPGLVGVVMADGKRSTGTLFGVSSVSAGREPAIMPERARVPAARQAGLAEQAGRYPIPAYTQNSHADPRNGAGAGVFPQTSANAGMENFHEALRGFARPGSRPAPDIMGDVLNEMEDSAVRGVTNNR